jgi:hypothetical protein
MLFNDETSWKPVELLIVYDEAYSKQAANRLFLLSFAFI